MPFQIIGRSSSHFTRVTRIFALELEVPFDFVPLHDITSTDAAVFQGNPALKIPTLRRPNGGLLFGTENICRVLAEAAHPARRVVWPEHLREDISRNAQEMVWHGMTTQVQLVIGTMVSKLPADAPYFVKARAGFAGALAWLDSSLPAILQALPADRELSLFETTLFCLVQHMPFRGTLALDPYPALRAFAEKLSRRPSSQRTAYQFDVA